MPYRLGIEVNVLLIIGWFFIDVLFLEMFHFLEIMY